MSETGATPPAPPDSSAADERFADEVRRIMVDTSASSPVLAYLGGAMIWLAFGSIIGLLTGLKMNLPDWLGSVPQMSFGRLRPIHLNTVVYGWVAMGGAGLTTWLMGRLCRAEIRWPGLLYISALVWNLGLLLGCLLVFTGYSNGMEWLELPLPSAGLIALGFVLFSISMLKTFGERQVDHIYISLWYILAALVWFPVLYLMGNSGFSQGVGQATLNWWYAHNVLTVLVTPLGLAAVYYFLPKVIGRPIYSYTLGLLGFWSFALFYNWNGLHHLVGGPVPTWAVSASIVASLMMFVPVAAVAVNHHMTAFRHLRLVRYSPTLRFVVFGAMCFTVVSFQGSLEATRTMQEITHFTHYTVGHAHLGVYAFATMVLFGGIYYMMPRLARWEWPHPGLIRVHFWLTAVGVLLYFFALEIGGWQQGQAMIDGNLPFMESVNVTIPYIWGRSTGGLLMTLGNLLFIYHFALVVYRAGPVRFAPAWVRRAEEAQSS